jgi:protein phosphatase
VAILVHPRGTEVAHVGDSRCYHLHAAQIRQVTKDHSMVQEMVDRGLLTPAEAKAHPEANKITRALGMDSSIDVEVRAEPVAHVSGDSFILCTDGLCDLVEPAEILRIVGSAPPSQSAGQLVDLANARGGYDNITVLVAKVKESAGAVREPVAPTVVQTAVQSAAPAPPPKGATTSVPPESLVPSGRSRGTLYVGVALGVVGVGVAIAMIVGALSDRGGAHHRHARQVEPASATPLLSSSAIAPPAAASDAEATLEPKPAPTDAIPPLPTQDLPPLAPAPKPHATHHPR